CPSCRGSPATPARPGRLTTGRFARQGAPQRKCAQKYRYTVPLKRSPTRRFDAARASGFGGSPRPRSAALAKGEISWAASEPTRRRPSLALRASSRHSPLSRRCPAASFRASPARRRGRRAARASPSPRSGAAPSARPGRDHPASRAPCAPLARIRAPGSPPASGPAGMPPGSSSGTRSWHLPLRNALRQDVTQCVGLSRSLCACTVESGDRLSLPIVQPLLLIAALSLSGPWKRVAPGVETAPAAELGGDPAWAARVVVADPARARLLVRYDASRPTLAEWRRRYPTAIAIVNGSFYSRDGAEVRPTCELVSDGQRVRGAGCQRQDALF